MKFMLLLLSFTALFSCNDQPSTLATNADSLIDKEATFDTIRKLDTPKTRIFAGVELYQEGEENYLQEIKMDKKVIEALVTNSKVLYVSVKDEGTSQNSYAEYLCTLLAEFEADIKKVKIVKAVSTAMKTKQERDYGIVLGEADCQ